MPEVAGLYLHPIKGCRSIAVPRATLDAFGFVGDRRFLVVDDNGRFLTQRDTPRLALIEATESPGRIALRAPARDPIDVPIDPGANGGAALAVTIWRDTCRALDLGAPAAAWLTGFLGRPARLVRMTGEHMRPMRAPTAQAGDQVAFSDGHPLLVLSEASLADLNARLDEPLPMNRFRPNVVVRGAAAFDEDRWRSIQIGECTLRASGPCLRCVVTTTDQSTLERGKEPLRTLALYRRTPEGEVFFGQNYIHETKSGDIAVGMPVTILEI